MSEGMYVHTTFTFMCIQRQHVSQLGTSSMESEIFICKDPFGGCVNISL